VFAKSVESEAMPQRSSIEKIRADLAWVIESVDPKYTVTGESSHRNRFIR
jgi:hypothetical protein